MRFESKLRWYLVLMLAAGMFAALATRVEATERPDPPAHDHHDGGDVDIGITGGDLIGGDLTGGDLIGGELSTGGDRSYAVGGSSFDVDINQCLASKATNIVLVGWQTLKENPTCIADGLDARGNHNAAATVRCLHVDTIRDSYSDFKTCKSEVTMVPVKPPDPPLTPADTIVDRDEDDRYEALQQQLATLVEDNERSRRAATKFVAKRREDAEYAEQLIEQLRQIEEPPNDN